VSTLQGRPGCETNPPTPEERALAANIALLPFAETRSQIVAADAAAMTAGLERALVDLAVTADSDDPQPGLGNLASPGSQYISRDQTCSRRDYFFITFYFLV
jgi:hypothetical protein